MIDNLAIQFIFLTLFVLIFFVLNKLCVLENKYNKQNNKMQEEINNLYLVKKNKK